MYRFMNGTAELALLPEQYYRSSGKIQYCVLQAQNSTEALVPIPEQYCTTCTYSGNVPYRFSAHYANWWWSKKIDGVVLGTSVDTVPLEQVDTRIITVSVCNNMYSVALLYPFIVRWILCKSSKSPWSTISETQSFGGRWQLRWWKQHWKHILSYKTVTVQLFCCDLCTDRTSIITVKDTNWLLMSS